MTTFTENTLNNLPESARFSDEDAEIILKYRDTMKTWEDGLVQGFYDSLYGHEVTRAVFSDGERPAREKTLRDWFQRTINGPFDSNYWEWQNFVGLVHVKRGVNNAMVAGMWGWLMNYLGKRAMEELEPQEALKLIKAVHSLQAQVMSLIVESYLRNILVAIDKAAGINEALIYRLVGIEIDNMLSDARADRS